MFCAKCGAKCKEGAKYCPKCGAEIKTSASANEENRNRTGKGSENVPNTKSFVNDQILEKSENSGMKKDNQHLSESKMSLLSDWLQKRKKLIGIVLIVIIVVVVIIVAVSVHRHRSQNQQDSFREHVELGIKYMDEFEYEEAVTEFTEALDIEQNMQTYMYLADAYIGMEDEEMAEEIYDLAIEAALDSYDQTGTLPEDTGEVYAAAINYYTLQGNSDKVEEFSESMSEIPDFDIEITGLTINAMDEDYYKKISDYLDDFGEPVMHSTASEEQGEGAEEGEYYSTGVILAKLVDLDGDGQDELIMAYTDTEADDPRTEDVQAYRLAVWTFSDGEMQEVYNESIVDVTGDEGGADTMTIGVAESEDSRHLVTETVFENRRKCDVLEWQDGQMAVTESLCYYWDKESSNWIHEENGENITYETWHQSYNTWFADCEIYGLFGSDGNGLAALSELETTAAELEQLLQMEEPSDITGLTESYGVYWNYYHRVTAFQELYGESEIIEMSDSMSYINGLAYIRLLDFNKDDKEELVLAYENSAEDTEIEDFIPQYTVEVWGYENSEVKRLYSGAASGESRGYASIDIKEVDDIYYMVQDNSHDDVISMRVWEYNGIHFESVWSCYLDVSENTKRNFYGEINGENVTEEEWYEEYNVWISDVNSQYYLYAWSAKDLEKTLSQEELEFDILQRSLKEETDINAEEISTKSEESYVDWVQLYRDYIVNLPENDTFASNLEINGMLDYSFSLMYIDNDDIPELLCQNSKDYGPGIIDVGMFSNTYYLVTIKDGELVESGYNRGATGTFTYIEHSGLFCVIGGYYRPDNKTMQNFSDTVYDLNGPKGTVKLFDGTFKKLTRYKEGDDGVFQLVYTDGVNEVRDVTREEYMAALNAVYDTDIAVETTMVSMDEILEQLESY